MSKLSPNVRIRPNVISLDDFLSRATADFKKALTWEELHQYVSLFWGLQRNQALAQLTPEQDADRNYLVRTRQQLGDPYEMICHAHEFLLPPPGSVNPGEEGHCEPPVVNKGLEPVVAAKEPARENPQERVIRAPVDARQLVLAPPGTGKTHTVIERLAHLNEAQFGGDLSRVLLVSFSRAAAAEIGQRLTAALRQGVGKVYSLPRLSTLDSLAGQLLMRDLGLPAQGQGFDDSIRSLTDLLTGAQGPQLRQEAANLLRQRLRVVMVDEVQDVVGVRARLVRNLLEALKPVAPGVLVLGDLRQAIHGFALERQTEEDQAWTPFRLVRELQGLFPDLERIEFTRQHRFSPSCQELMTDLRGAMDGPAPALPGENPDRDRLRNLLDRVQELDDPHMLFGSEFRRQRVAVLARTNSEVDRLELACQPIARDLGRTVRRSGDGGQEGYPAWVARVLAKQPAQASLNEEGFLGLYRQRVSDDPLAARQALDWLAAACRIDPRAFRIGEIIEMIEGDARVPTDLREPARPDELWLSTIHQAKGREFETVVVCDPVRLLGSSEPEEARILYVALTRARSAVFRCRGPCWLPRAFQTTDVPIDLAGDSLQRLQAPDFQEALWNCQHSFREVFVGPAQSGIYHLEIVLATRVVGPQVTREFLDAVALQAGVPYNVLQLERPTFRLEVGSLRSRVVGLLDERRLVLVPIFSGPLPVRR